MRFKSVNGFAVLMLDPASFAITSAGRGNDGGVHKRAGLDRHGFGLELPRHLFKKHPVKSTSHQFLAEAHKRSPLGRALMLGEAAEPAKRRTVIQGFGQLYIREIAPNSDKKRLEKGQRRPRWLAFGRAVNPIKPRF
jgi:hypothetical protein